MKKEEPKTDFNFSYAGLEQLGDKADDLMTRDAAELLEYGVDAAYQTDVATRTQALKDYPTDEELKSAAAIATEQKEVAADDLRVSIRGMMVRVKQVFRPGSATYNGFGTKGLDDMNGNELVRCAHRVSRLATQYLTELTPKGVTAALITDLDTDATALDEAIDAQDTANRVRNEATQERVEMANVLYAIIVELFDFGKDYWYTRNEAKYNDYIIYDTPGGGATPPDPTPDPTPIVGTVAAMSTVNVVSGLATMAVVRVANTGSVNFTVCTAMSSDESCTLGVTVMPGMEEILDGSASSGPLNPFLNITNNDPAMEAAYSVVIEA